MYASGIKRIELSGGKMKRFFGLFLAVFLMTGSAFSGAKKVIYTNPMWWNEHTPANLVANQSYIETLPFDGVGVFALPACLEAMNKGRICTYAEIYDNNFKLMQGKFTKVTYNWSFIFIGEPADWYDNASWNQVINNWRLFARASKAAGFVGIVFDNEGYGSKGWNYLYDYPGQVDSSSKYTLEQYRVQAHLRGHQIMQACVEEFPNIQVMFYHGPYLSEIKSTVDKPLSGGTELLGAFFSGFVEATIGTQACMQDGGECGYAYRTLAQFQNSYNWRKDTIASEMVNSPNIPVALRPNWPQKVKISYGLYPRDQNPPAMTPTVMRSAMEYALRTCDDVVWFYSEARTSWLAPGNADAQTWLPSISGAKAAVNSGIYFSCDKMAGVQAGGKFSFQFVYDNFTGSAATLTYTKKPAWITATNGNQTITGTAPNSPSVDTIKAVVSAGGKSDTAKLTIIVSTYYFIEAESGTLTAPMEKGNDPAASGGQYITTPAGTGNTIFPKVEVTYSFNVPITATYYVWLLTYTQTLNPTVNYGTFLGFNGKFVKPGAANKTAGQYEWAMCPTANNLTAGPNQLVLGHGCEQVRVDKIIITNSSSVLLPSTVTRSLPDGKKNPIQRKNNLSIRIMPSGAIEYLGAGDNLRLSVRDIFGREVAAGKTGINFRNKNSFVSNGIYFAVLQQKEDLASIGKFVFVR